MRVVGELLQKSGVYKITCISTGKMYIGSSNLCKRRRTDHLCELRHNRHGSIRLQNAFNKYGEGAFEFEVIEYCPLNEIRDTEQKYLDAARSYDRDVGYNMSPSAHSSTYEYTPEIRAKLSESAKRALRNMTPEAKERMRQGAINAGKSNLGSKRDDSFKTKRSEYMKENPVKITQVERSDGVVFRSIKEAAEFHGVSRSTMRKWCNGRPVKNVELRKFTFKIKE